MPTNSVFLGLGSNLDKPRQQIQQAISTLEADYRVKVIKVSSLWGSKPMGPKDQPDYLNVVVLIETELLPYELLDLCQAIERNQRRVRDRHWGPRTIDLDILLYDDLNLESERLCIPHVGLTERSFVLFPLQEISPELIVNKKPLGYWIESLPDAEIFKL